MVHACFSPNMAVQQEEEEETNGEPKVPLNNNNVGKQTNYFEINFRIQCGGGLGQWLAPRSTGRGVPGSRPSRVVVRCGLEQVTFPNCLVMVKPRKPSQNDQKKIVDWDVDWDVKPQTKQKKKQNQIQCL